MPVLAAVAGFHGSKFIKLHKVKVTACTTWG